MRKILKYWLSPKIPDQHTKPKYEEVKDLKKIRSFLVHWFIHPLKRRLAKYYCLFLKRFFGLRVIAITGSSGKSTTKEMIASVLKLESATVYSLKNIDPVYNIPSSILKCSFKTKYLVLEMGVEFPNEMDFYLWLVKPDISIITSIYPTHTEFFKDTKGVYQEKIKIAQKLDKRSSIVLNSESGFLKKYSKGKKNIIFYGEGSLIFAEDISYTLKGTQYTLNIYGKKEKIELPTVGKVNVSNSLAAIAVLKRLNVNINTIKKGLKSFKSLEHRLNVFKKNQAIIIDDTYNSNPEALKESLEVFNFFSKERKKVLVIGDMLELGTLSKKLHLEVAEKLLRTEFDYLICVGKESRYIFDFLNSKVNKKSCFWVKGQELVDQVLRKLNLKDSTILLKGSRSIGLDKVVDRLFK